MNRALGHTVFLSIVFSPQSRDFSASGMTSKLAPLEKGGFFDCPT
jgi:hypothetical protein